MAINTKITKINALGANGPLFKDGQEAVVDAIIAAVNTNTAGLATAVTNTPTLVRASASLNFGSTAAGTSTDLTIAAVGAAVGNPVMLGVPNAATLSNGLFTAWVSATDVVTVRFSSNQLVGALDPASGTFYVAVLTN